MSDDDRSRRGFLKGAGMWRAACLVSQCWRMPQLKRRTEAVLRP